jgi:hypothetical protein
MPITMVIDEYILQNDYLGNVVSAGYLLKKLLKEVIEAGYNGIAPRCIVSGLGLKSGLDIELIESHLRKEIILQKGSKIFVWKKA